MDVHTNDVVISQSNSITNNKNSLPYLIIDKPSRYPNWDNWDQRRRGDLLCCLPDPFRGMGAWRKTMEPQKPGNSPGSGGPEVIKRQRVAKE